MDSNGSSLIQNKNINILPAWTRIGLLAIPGIFICLFFIWPMANLALNTFEFSAVLDAYSKPGIVRIIGFTFLQATLSTVATLIVAIGPTYLLSRWDFKGRRFLSALIVVPFMLPTVVVASAFLALLPDSLHNTLFAIVVVHVFFNIAVITRIVGSSWKQIPQDQENASKTLGASRWSTFIHVTFPLVFPAIISACTVVFLFCFTSFGVIQIIGGPSNSTLETEIARRALSLGDLKVAAILSFSQMLFLGFVFIGSKKFSTIHATKFRASDTRLNRPLNLKQKAGVRLSFLIIVSTIMIPILAIFWSSLHVGNKFSTFGWEHLGEVQIRPGVSTSISPIDSIIASFQYLFIAVMISLVIGTIASLCIYKLKITGRILDAGLMAPMATSAVTIGLGMLITFNTYPVNWRASQWLIPVGHALIAIPFIVRTLLPALVSAPVAQTWASAALGASPVETLVRVDLQRIRRPIVNGAGIAAAISLGEFGATTLLSRSGQDSMPIAIAKLIAKTGDIPRTQAFVLSSILAICVFAIVFTIEARNA